MTARLEVVHDWGNDGAVSPICTQFIGRAQHQILSHTYRRLYECHSG